MTTLQKRLYTGVLFGAIFFMSSSHALRASLLTSMIDHYGLASSQQGFPSSVASLGSMLAMLLSFALMGRVKKPTLLLIAAGLSTVLLFPQYLLPGYAAFIALNLLFGIALGIMDTLLSSSMADLHAGRRAAAMMSALHACYGVGGIVSPMVYGAILKSGAPWNSVYLATMGFGVLLLIYMAPVSLRQSALPASADIQASGLITRAGLKDFFKDRHLAALTGFALFFGLFLGGINTWIIRFVNVTYSAKLGDLTLSLVYLGITAGRLVTPLTGIGQTTYLKLMGFVAWALLSAALLIGSGGATVALICLAFFLSGSMLPFALSAACQLNRRNTMLASTILFFALYVGQTICAPLIGAVEARAGLPLAMEICYLFAAVSSGCALIGLKGKRDAA
jgi:FHS family Na+ dependent glucose MFS transporter 1